MTDDSADGSRYHPFPGAQGWAEDFDSTVVDPFVAILDNLRRRLSAEDLDAGVRVATRYAAVDTGAIEGLYAVDRGFTRTIATEAAAWESTLRSRGDDVARSIEDALEGYEMVLDAVTRSTPITESWIRQLHETICASQEQYTVYTEVGLQRRSLPKGQYKTSPNSPTNPSTGSVHHYAPVHETIPEMARLIEQLTSPAFRDLHPVVQAAYAHYAFVCVHPFADGNGRVARALASVYLYRSPGVPLVVFADQRDEYLDVLEDADQGDSAPFIRFIEQRTMDAVTLVETHSPAEGVPSAEESLRRISHDSIGRGGLDHRTLNALTKRIMDTCRRALTDYIKGLDLDGRAKLQVGDAPARTAAPAGYRSAPGVAPASLTAMSTGPVGVHVAFEYQLWVARPEATGTDFILSPRTVGDELNVMLREVHPTVGEIFGIKVAAWARRQVDRALADLGPAVAEQLRHVGYLPREPSATPAED